MMKTRIGSQFKTLQTELQSILRREIDYYQIKPRVSTLFITFRCNSKCKTCSMWQRPQDEEIEKEINLDEWKIIIDKLTFAGIESVEIFGGNALLRKEIVISLMKYLYEKGITIHMPTNQMGLDDEVAEAIARYVDTAYLSIDAPGEQQDSVRGIVGAAHQAEDAVEKLIRFKHNIHDRINPLKVVCNCTVSKFNVGTLKDMVPYALAKGFDRVDFEYAGEFDRQDVNDSALLGITPDAQYIRQDETILANRNEALQIKQSLREIRKTHKHSPIVIETLNIDSLSLTNLYEGSIPHTKCYVKRNEVTIDPYGNIVACPFITNLSFGNLVSEPFNQIWSNEKHGIFDKAQCSGRLPMCKSCILGVQRNPGMAKSLQRIYLSKIRPKL